MATLNKLVADVVRMRTLVGTYLAVPVLNDKQRAALAVDLRQLDKVVAALAAYEPPLDATHAKDAPSGLTNWGAAQVDASFVLRALQGADAAELANNPVPGAAKALGFSGVVASSDLYATFLDGDLTGTSETNPGAGPDGFTMRFGLAAGIDPYGPYLP